MDPVTETIIISGITLISGLVIGKIATDVRYKKGKKILTEMRKFFDAADDAVYDDKITEEEFREAWAGLKGVYEAIMT
jgi:hypothetical protein